MQGDSCWPRAGLCIKTAPAGARAQPKQGQPQRPVHGPQEASVSLPFILGTMSEISLSASTANPAENGDILSIRC